MECLPGSLIFPPETRNTNQRVEETRRLLSVRTGQSMELCFYFWSMKYLTFHFFLEIYRLKICTFLKFALLIELNRYKHLHIYKMFTGATVRHQLFGSANGQSASSPLQVNNNSDEGPENAQAFPVSSFYFTNKTLMLFLSCHHSSGRFCRQ